MIFAWGLVVDEGSAKSFLWFVLIYLALTLGELCLSPIGLSMVTKLSVQKIVGMMMGVWFLGMAFGNYMSGVIGGLAGNTGHGADAALLDMDKTVDLFNTVGLLGIGVGIFILILTPWLRKGMHGVH